MTQTGLKEFHNKFYDNFPHITTLEHGQHYEPMVHAAEQWWADQKPTQDITPQEWMQWRPNLIFKSK